MNKGALVPSVIEMLRRQIKFSAAGLGVLLAAAVLPGRCAVPATPPPDVRRDATVASVEKVLPSVVNIATTTLIEFRDPFEALLREMWGLPQVTPRRERQPYSIGSGVIIDEAGYLLTNDHVVRRASEIWVKLTDGRERQADRVVTTSLSDVALLKIRAQPGEKFTAVKFAAGDDLLLGETVIALGNPYGLGGSVSRGILSSKSRRPPPDTAPLDVADWLQTDAAINPGSSGGPLINLKGELIGLNVAVYREGQGIGFAIPIKLVAQALGEIFTPERLQSLWFGAQVRADFGPLTVLAVEPESPAGKAGLREGDVITQINGKPPRTFIEFHQELVAGGGKKSHTLVLQRGGERRTATLRLVPESTFFNAGLIRRKLGAELQEMTPELARYLNITWTHGFIVSEVDGDGPAAQAKLQPGLVVRRIDGQPLGGLAQAARLLHGKKEGDPVELEVLVQQRRGPFVQSQLVNVSVVVR